MKKLLSIYVLMLLAGCVFAQNTPVTMTGTATLTNADTVELTQTVNGVYNKVSLQVVMTKYSGTVAGFVVIKGSVDGTNFVNINTDSLTLANQTTNTKVWVLEGSMYKYYKLTTITTGTSSVQAKGYFFGTGQGGANHSVSTMVSDISASSDTVTNTGSGYVQLQVKGSYSSIAIQAVSNKISGTAAGTVTLQGSNDGTNFVTVDASYLYDMSTSAPYTTGGSATLSVTNVATSTGIFVLNGSPYAYYRLSHTGSGAMVSRLRGYLMPNK
jgi:hypothetical protein